MRGNLLKKLFGNSPQEKFWRWFEENSEELFSADTGREPIIDELTQKLKAIDENLVFEMSPILSDGKREFVISADGIRRVFPAVQELVAIAPEHPKWKITAFRQPMPQRLFIKIEGYVLSYDEIWFTHQKNEDGQYEDLVLYIQNFSPETEKLASIASFILLNSLIGEYIAATRIGVIERKSLPESPESQGLQPFHELKEIVGIRGQG